MAAKKSKVPIPEKHGNGYREKVTVNGIRYAATFATREEAYRWGLDMKFGRIIPLKLEQKDWTVGDAVDNYIEKKRKSCKKSTIAGYQRIRKNRAPELMAIPINKVTEEMLNREIERMTKYSPKTIKETFSLIVAALKSPPIGRTFNLDPIIVPKPRKALYDINDIPRIIVAFIGTDVELPVNLGLRHGLRMSEIRGLKWKDYINGKLYVYTALTDEGFEDSTKEGDVSDRIIVLSAEVISLLESSKPSALNPDECIIKLNRRQIYDRYIKILNKNGIRHYRFHELRHLYASYLLHLGIPKYRVAKMLGWSSEEMLNERYGHSFKQDIDDDFNRSSAELALLVQNYSAGICKDGKEMPLLPDTNIDT